MGKPVWPFNREHPVSYSRFFQSQIIGRGLVEPVEIRVIQRQPPAAVFVQQRKRRTADVAWIDTQSLCKPANECRLSRAEIPGE